MVREGRLHTKGVLEWREGWEWDGMRAFAFWVPGCYDMVWKGTKCAIPMIRCER